ncbi:MAG: hypothetical protein HUU50_05115 [Candidatus Brocadiae bacterium]|nr:hypothetical protein [Candidatus Brocadiia bacterium]
MAGKWHFIISFSLLIVIYHFSLYLHKLQPSYSKEEYLCLSSNKRIRQFAFGFEGELATLLWIQSQISLNQKMVYGHEFTKMFALYDTITDLDPYFYDVYFKGPWYLMIAYRDPIKGIEFLESGTQKIPHESWIWLLLGQMYRLQRWELEHKQCMTQKEALERSLRAFQKAILLEKDQETMEGLRDFLENPGGILDTITWASLYCQSLKNPLLAAIFLKNFHKHILSFALEFLHVHIMDYKEKFHRFPVRLADMDIPYLREPTKEQSSSIAIELYRFSKAGKTSEDIEKCLINLLANPSYHAYNYDHNTGNVSSSFLKKKKKE